MHVRELQESSTVVVKPWRGKCVYKLLIEK